jgi:hypothetical protein
VWASVRGSAIAVGAATVHEDFERFGRDVSETVVAREAFTHLVTLLREHGHPEAAP